MYMVLHTAMYIYREDLKIALLPLTPTIAT